MGKRRGAKGKYETCVKPYLKEVNEKVRQGVIEEEIAKALGISVASLNNYRNKYPEFAEALSKNKGADVLNRLLNAGIEAAIGGTQIVSKPFKLQKKTYENGKLVSVDEYIEMVDVEEYIPANASLNQFYVLNYGKNKGFTRDPLEYDMKKQRHDQEMKERTNDKWELDLNKY